MDELIIQEIKKAIDAISLFQQRANTLKEDLDFYNENGNNLPYNIEHRSINTFGT